jgi:hypothetical protein
MSLAKFSQYLLIDMAGFINNIAFFSLNNVMFYKLSSIMLCDEMEKTCSFL